jgi:chemotaxis protein methyltransferase CheR
VRDLPPEMALPRRADGRYEVPERLRRQISFARHNLVDVVPSSAEGWDVIVCRNVLMYLARERVPEILQQLGAALRPGGYLFVGANDVLERPPPLLRFVRFGQRYVLWRPPVLAPLMIPPARVPQATIPLAPTAPATVSPATILPSILPSTTPATPPAPAPADAVRLALPSGTFDVEPSPGRAHALLLEGKTDAALELALAVLEADPLSVAARLIAGIAYQLAGDAQQATAALRAALVLAPDLWPAEMYLGFALFGIGDETGASRALRRGAELAATTERLPLPPSVATWFEAWRGDAIAMARHARAGTSQD